MCVNVGMVVLARLAFGSCTSFLYGRSPFLPDLTDVAVKKCKLDQGPHASDSQSNSPYQYTAHLLALDGYRPIGPPDHSISEISTPLNITAWERALADHPDKLFAQYLIQDLINGFRIGFDRTNHQSRRIYCPHKPILKWLKTTWPRR